MALTRLAWSILVVAGGVTKVGTALGEYSSAQGTVRPSPVGEPYIAHADRPCSILGSCPSCP
eukprot:5877239-Heterocapsa_arctica.AAC.1